jgi:hypothetical protein
MYIEKPSQNAKLYASDALCCAAVLCAAVCCVEERLISVEEFNRWNYSKFSFSLPLFGMTIMTQYPILQKLDF